VHRSTKSRYMALWLNYRPDLTPPPAAMSLNPEPAVPEEREAQHLPPKSFADAAQEALEPQSHANGTHDAAEHDAQPEDVMTDAPKSNGVKVLRIVDIDGHQNDDKASSEESPKESHHESPKESHEESHKDSTREPPEELYKESSRVSSNESSIKDQESYEGTGIDETPKSPKAKTHHRKSSRSSLGSVGRTYGVSIKNDLKHAAQDAKDEAAHLKHEADGTFEKVENNGKRQKLEDIFMQEKPHRVNGDALTTMKSFEEVKGNTRVDRPLKRRDSELKAGRQAGAGWATSKYVHLMNNSPPRH
jgi:hypothetical protein